MMENIKGFALAFAFLFVVIASTVFYNGMLSETKVGPPPIYLVADDEQEKQQIEETEKSMIKEEKKPKKPTNIRLEKYYKESGSKYPKIMMSAVLQTKRPKLMAAISVVESNGNYTVRNGGYKNRHHGAWQVNPKWWGVVPKNALQQAQQAERIIDIYLKQYEGDLIKALNKYGGCSQGLYASSILNEMKNVPDML